MQIVIDGINFIEPFRKNSLSLFVTHASKVLLFVVPPCFTARVAHTVAYRMPLVTILPLLRLTRACLKAISSSHTDYPPFPRQQLCGRKGRKRRATKLLARFP